MKRLILALASVFLLALIVVPSFPQAQTDTQVFKVPFNLGAFVPCANDGLGEVILGSGTLHVTISSTVNKNNIHQVMTFNPQGVTAVGQSTGTTYHAVGVTRMDLNASVAAFPFDQTYVNRFFMISEGPEGNLKVKQTVHITVNANGTTTANFNDFEITCQ